MEEFHKVRQKMSPEMADNSALIKNLVVQAEDARMMNDMFVSKMYMTECQIMKGSSKIHSWCMQILVF